MCFNKEIHFVFGHKVAKLTQIWPTKTVWADTRCCKNNCFSSSRNNSKLLGVCTKNECKMFLYTFLLGNGHPDSVQTRLQWCTV